MNRLVRFLVMLLVAFALIGLINWLDPGPMIILGGLLIILIVVVVFLLRKASK